MPPTTRHLKLPGVIVELINTGSELLLGRILNTHQQWLCRRLADLGYTVSRQVAVPDAGVDIQQAVRESLSRADLVITTGGLGPTSDDLTRELIAQLLGRRLIEDAAVVEQIKSYFVSRNRPVPASTRLEALVPVGAQVLVNRFGTAPGLAIEVTEEGGRSIEGGAPPAVPTSARNKWLIMLPGPPRELRPMFNEHVAPLLPRVLPLADAFVCLTLRTTGLGESTVAEKIGERLRPFVERGLDLGYCARMGQVDVRLSARGDTAAPLVREAELLTRELLQPHIFGTQDDDLETIVVQLLTRRKQTLALAESCTGGGLAHRVTNVPGASVVFPGGFVTYSNALKEKILGVRAETLAAHGAVSKAVACQMAEGARQQAGADYALSVTGIAGPGGGTPEKPVGTVFIALAAANDRTVAVRNFNPWDRETFKHMTVNQALELLRRKMLAAA